jgi:putative SOS response-associated peptidase YedK
MCGRFASFLPAEAMARIFGTTNPLPNLAPSWNAAPINDVAVVRRHPETGAAAPRPAEVGLAALLETDQSAAADQRTFGDRAHVRHVQAGPGATVAHQVSWD